MSQSLLHQMQNQLATLSDARRLLVGYSGGLDSSVLLHLLCQLRDQGQESRPVLAIHINHQLSPLADQWQSHCEAQCQELDVPIQVCRARVERSGRGLEDAAREQRYQAFSQLLQQGDALLLAHHQDDQAETLLLRLMRGAGPRGLAAMPRSRPLGDGQLFRPLLHFQRQQLHDWAVTADMSWVDDDSNGSLDFDRNYLRHQVMPLLEERWPGFAGRWQQSAALCREADEQLQSQACDDLTAAELRSERWGWSLCLAYLQSLSEFRRGNLLRQLMTQLQLPLPDSVHLEQIERQLLQPRDDAQGAVCWGPIQLRHYRQRLYFLPETLALGPPELQCWDLQQPLVWGDGELRAWEVASAGLLLPPGSDLEVGVRQPGDRCKPIGRGRSQTLKKLLQEYALEPWLRDSVPVLRHRGEIVAVGDLWVCEGYGSGDGPGYLLQWQAPARSD
ncbi:MAG: tRNA lysidine(34) synthetase TilS [Candidatus Pelagadaptatus aseana]|uniref:tRNA lysidine(34) synthetase TilS n=1 Tax=Candidatus Pelagadaptatus aseana TaxID=3120508 RepID=UPI0039B2252F